MIGIGQLKHNWHLAKMRLTFAKKEELRWRMLVALQLFPDAKIGANTAHGLTLTTSENYTLEKDTNKIGNVLQRIVTECPDDLTVYTLVSYAPTLSKPAYEALSDKAKSIFAEVLTIKPATPSLKKKGGEDDG